MQLSFRTNKLRKEFEDERALKRGRGAVQAEKIKVRITQMEAAINLEELRN